MSAHFPEALVGMSLAVAATQIIADDLRAEQPSGEPRPELEVRYRAIVNDLVTGGDLVAELVSSFVALSGWRIPPHMPASELATTLSQRIGRPLRFQVAALAAMMGGYAAVGRPLSASCRFSLHEGARPHLLLRGSLEHFSQIELERS